MMIDIEKLADQFSAADIEDWRRLVDKVLGSRSFDDALKSSTYDGISVEPLYFERGEQISAVPGVRSGRWDIRQMPLHPDPATANREILDDLEGGAISLHLKIHPSSWGSADPGRGVVIRDQKDFDRALKNFQPDIAAISLDPGPDYLSATSMLSEFWAREARSADQVRGSLGIDPLGSLAQHGRLAGPLDSELMRLAGLAALAVVRWPGVDAVSVDTTVYHNAGASEAQELAAALASGIVYLKAIEAHGLALEQAVDQIAFRFAADTDVLLTLAKLRAFRRLWQGILENCGVSEAAPARVHVLTSERMLTRLDPWGNILRVTIAGFAAGIAGADAITLDPFTAALGVPNLKARRLARNIQLLLIEESNLHRVTDPLAGAHGVEALTDELSAAAWRLFQDIEGQGGMAVVLRSGWFRGQISTVADERVRRLRCRGDLLTGLSSFPKLDEAQVRVAEFDPALYEPRDQQGASDAQIDGFEDPAPAGGASEEGEAFAPIRLAEPFEKLRQRASDWAGKNDRQPRVFMANLGRPSDFIAAATYAHNLFASAGFEAISTDGFKDQAALIEALEGVEAEVAVICGTPEDCRARAGEVMAKIRAAGIIPVYLAGEPETLAGEDQANLTGGFYESMDAVAELEALHEHLEGSS
jgi:methylmalonyl-CoA mutase